MQPRKLTHTLKNYLEQRASAHYGPNNASLALLCSSDDRYQQIIIDTRALLENNKQQNVYIKIQTVSS